MMWFLIRITVVLVLYGSRNMALPPEELLSELVKLFEVDFLVYLTSNKLELIDWVRNSSFPGRHFVITGWMDVESVKKFTIARGIRTILAVVNQKEAIWDYLIEVFPKNITRSTYWLLSSSDNFSPETFRNIYIPFDCPFFSVNPLGNILKITEVYKVQESSEIINKYFGVWTEASGLSTTMTPFYSRRTNFEGRRFKAYITHNPPYTHVTKLKNNTLSFGGYFLEVWKELEYRLKFSTEFIVANKIQLNILSYDVPFMVGPVAQEPEAAEISSLSEPIHKSRVFLFGHRPGSELEWNSYLKPFSTELWLTTLGWMFCSSAALSGLYWLGWKHGTSEIRSNFYVFTIGTSLTTVFRALCAQGSDVTPNSSGCRLLFLSIYLSALVVTSAFSAALFSLLTVPISKAPFNKFEDVQSSKGYKLTTINNSDIYYGIKALAEKFNKSEYNRMFKMLEKKLPDKVESALERVCKDKSYVFMWDLPNVLEKLQNMTIDCRNKVMPGGPVVFEELIGFGIVKNSPYQEMIDLHLVRMKNEGILSRLSLNTWPPRIPNVINTWVRVTVADISPIIYLFTAGAAFGTVILLLEHLFTKRHNRINSRSVRDTHEFQYDSDIRGRGYILHSTWFGEPYEKSKFH